MASVIGLAVVILLLSIFMLIVASIALNCFIANTDDRSSPQYIVVAVGVAVSVILFVVACAMIAAARRAAAVSFMSVPTSKSKKIAGYIVMIIFASFFLAVPIIGMQCFDANRSSAPQDQGEQDRINNEYNIMIAGLVASALLILLCFIAIGLALKPATKKE